MHPAENLQKDGFINNNDCNNRNWGILRSESGDVLSPIYDNGASFSPNVPEKRIINKLHNLDSLEKGIYDSVTAYSLNGESNTRYSHGDQFPMTLRDHGELKSTEYAK